METKKILYQVGDTECQGYLAYDSAQKGKRPIVLVAHAWRGQDDFARVKALELAKLGMAAFAVDLYGNGQSVKSNEKAKELMTPLFVNRQLLRDRMLGAYQAASLCDVADNSKIGAIGFCFGGLAAIELLRSGAHLKGVVSFHALLGDTLGDLKALTLPNHKKAMQGSILLLHGADDPLVAPADVTNIQKELTDARVDWQMHIFGHTTHAFTNPEANDPQGGMNYQPLSSARGWELMRHFFAEIFK